MSDGPAVPSLDADPSETLAFRYEIGEDEPPSHALVTVTSAITGTGPTDLEPMGRHVDLEAMDGLLTSTDRSSPLSPSVVFETEGLSLAVRPAAIVGVARRGLHDWPADGQ